MRQFVQRHAVKLFLFLFGVLKLLGPLEDFRDRLDQRVGDEFLYPAVCIECAGKGAILHDRNSEGKRFLTDDLRYWPGTKCADARERGLVGLVADADGEIYSLSGQRVTNPQRGGIYIKNGKKFVK